MILMDTPRIDTFQGREIRTAHLISDIPGQPGTDELLDFARRLGLKAEWLQKAGTHHEHFDLMGVKCDAAQRMGAVVDSRALGKALVDKRRKLMEAGDGR